MRNLIMSAMAVTTVLLAGCASPKYNYVAKTEHFSIPPVDEVSMVGIGDQMLSQGTKTESDIVELPTKQEVSIYKMPAGEFSKIGEDDQYFYFSGINHQQVLIRAGVLETPAFDASLRIDRATGEFCVLRSLDTPGCGSVNYVLKKVSNNSASGFQQTLIYSGRIGDQLKISYREFSDNMARAAFSNEVYYDLGESNIIGYQGAKIEVLEATNTAIKYKVLSNFKQ